MLPAIRALAIVFICIGLQGCAFFAPANAVRPGTLGDAAKTQLVYGLDDEHGSLVLAFTRYDPETGWAGDCRRFDHTEASTSKAPGATSYHVFDVPPGHYVRSFYYTSHGQGPNAGGVEPTVYVVPSGTQVYLGTFTHRGVRYDLAEAKVALGASAEGLVEVEVVRGGKQIVPFLCSP